MLSRDAGRRKKQRGRHDIGAPTGPFPYGPLFSPARGGKSRRFDWDLFRGLMALALRDSKAEVISTKVLSLCKDELPWPQNTGLCWEKGGKKKVGKERVVCTTISASAPRKSGPENVCKSPQIFLC